MGRQPRTASLESWGARASAAGGQGLCGSGTDNRWCGKRECGPQPWHPNCRQSQAEAACFGARPGRCPAAPAPPEPSEATSQGCESKCRRPEQWWWLWPAPASSDEPPSSGGSLRLGRWSSGTHLLLAAGPVGALRLPLPPELPATRHSQTHSQSRAAKREKPRMMAVTASCDCVRGMGELPLNLDISCPPTPTWRSLWGQ